MKRMRMAAVVLAVVAMVGAGCPKAKEKVSKVIEEKFQPPTVEVVNVGLGEITTEKVEIIVDLEITNPNPISVNVSKVDYDLSLNEEPVMSGQLEPKVLIKASAVTPARVVVPVSFSQVLAIFTQVLGEDTVNYNVTGKVHVASPIGDIPIPFKQEGELPIPEVDDLY